jgi:nickel/cobalt transporter (NiCoT) family protein
MPVVLRAGCSCEENAARPRRPPARAPREVPLPPETLALAAPSRWTRIRGALTPREWRRVAALGAVILGLHAVGFFILVALVVPEHHSLGTQGGFGLGIGITAYTLGLRHAFDADHIAAIDNTTRKLMADGKRPLSVGFFFSLGHSTIVFGLAVLLAVGVRSMTGPVEDDASRLHDVTGLVGTGVSGTFLYVVAAINLAILIGIIRIVRRMRRGDLDEAELEGRLESRGLMNRVYGRATRAVKEPWQMYPLGILFGFGFDTATEVALLVLAAGAGIAGLPWYAILCLPILFAAGMSLLDTIDGAFMNFAYGWAFSKPVRKVFYNITITGLSVAVAFLVGTVELLSILADGLGLTGTFWDWVSDLDLNTVGFVIVGLFVGTWAVALAVWHFGHIEERWGARVRPAEPEACGR